MEKKTSFIDEYVRIGVRFVTEVDGYKGRVIGETTYGVFLDDGRGEKMFPWSSIVYIIKEEEPEA